MLFSNTNAKEIHHQMDIPNNNKLPKEVSRLVEGKMALTMPQIHYNIPLYLQAF